MNAAPTGPDESTETASVSIVIPTFNHAHYLGQAIASALAQSLAAQEVIVVDDGSTDRPQEVTRAFSKVRLIRQSNQGLSAARNTGLRAATGQYVLFLDADDRLLPNALETDCRLFDQRPECGFVYGACRIIDSEGKVIQQYSPQDVDNDAYAFFLSGNYVGCPATVLYRTDRLRAIGGFDAWLRACEDWDTYLRLARILPVASSQDVVAEYRVHGSNMSSNKLLMLSAALRVLTQQKVIASTHPQWWAAYRAGVDKVKRQYGNEFSTLEWEVDC
jgi:glycosyltransferase involved in cell wall biosynthesis